MNNNAAVLGGLVETMAARVSRRCGILPTWRSCVVETYCRIVIEKYGVLVSGIMRRRESRYRCLGKSSTIDNYTF